MTPEEKELFNRLVENAFDFLRKAINELEEYPKYSVINFYASVELFVKARLMAHDWKLVMIKDPDWKAFNSGNFQSVSLEEANKRLKNHVLSGLPSSQLRFFKNLSIDRNKMIHFFHEGHDPVNSHKLKQDIVKNHLKAWYTLHTLLTDKWNNLFSPWSTQIVDIDKSLRKLHDYLAVVFESLHDDIKAHKKDGFIFKLCPSCGFEAELHLNAEKTFYPSECLVCQLENMFLQIDCSACNSVVFFKNEGFSKCGNCGKDFEPKDLVELSESNRESEYVRYKNGDFSQPGNCSNCDGYHTVVNLDSGQYICTQCFERFDSLQTCEWCGEENTTDMEDSGWHGCNFCDGHKDYWDDD